MTNKTKTKNFRIYSIVLIEYTPVYRVYKQVKMIAKLFYCLAPKSDKLDSLNFFKFVLELRK